MSLKSFVCALIVAALLVPASGAGASGNGMFYVEVPKQGRIYVFAIGQRYDTFRRSGGTEVGTPIITRPGYGPQRETVVFDSEDAVNLYNFKHDLPGEYFPPTPEEKPKSSFPAGKFSGMIFGDYYFYDTWFADQISPTDPTPVEDQDGFWFRRIDFTYDLAFSQKFTTRFRLEANSNGRFAGGNLTPFVKDAYLKWNYGDEHAALLGIQPTVSIEWLDAFWGLRHIEKTPADLYRIDATRDFGLTFSGPLPVDALKYSVQVGNESGSGSETDEKRIVRVQALYERNSGIALEAFYSNSQRPDHQDRATAQGFAGYRSKLGRLGAQYVWQQRNSGVSGVPDQRIDVWSGFAVWNVRPKKADLFVRVDKASGDLGGTETGVPGIGTNDYLLLSPDSPLTTWIIGGEWFLTPSIRVGPNVELVNYDHDPDPINYPGRDESRVYRLTFYWTF